ncbi:hypothetical protein JCM8547_007474 [Rhodosporidiobolus lusitaniae]
MMMNVPSSCKCYVFEKEGAELTRSERKVPQIKDHEVLIKVNACQMGSCDEISRWDLLGMNKWPSPFGVNVTGRIVKCGKDVSSRSMMMGGNKLREGMMVCAIPMYGGMSEYCVADAMFACELSNDMQKMPLEACVGCYSATRIHCAVKLFEKMHSAMSKEEHMMCDELCARSGFKKGESCIAVYGEGGYAKLACDLLKSMQKSGEMGETMRKHRILLVCPSTRWRPEQYNMREEDVLYYGACDIRQELIKRGGVRWCCATDMPREGIQELLDGMRYNSQLCILSPGKQGKMELPVGDIIARNISVTGAPVPVGREIERCLELCRKHDVQVQVDRVDFQDENAVREAWRRMEQRDCFQCPVVEVCRMDQM